MQKGFARPLLLIIILLLLLTPAVLLLVNKPDVKGSTSSTKSYAKPGFEVSVVSSGGTWELVQYLCETENECTSFVESGIRSGSVGGGQTTLQKVAINYTSDWADYDFIKVYVKPGWGSTDRTFNVADKGAFADALVKKLELVDGGSSDAVLLPINELMDKFQKSVTFSDK